MGHEMNAWIHVYNMFKEAGATNVIWIWSPHLANKSYTEFYPGNKYVDWIGLTTLNYGTVGLWSQWWSFNVIFQKKYYEFSNYEKPIMITEFGSLDVGGDRASWYRNSLDSLSQKFPKVNSVVFFHASGDNTTTYKLLIGHLFQILKF